MNVKESVEYFISAMREQGMDVAKKFIYEGVISCEAELIPHIMSTIINKSAEEYYTMLAEYLKIDKEIKENNKLGINNNELKEKNANMFIKIQMKGLEHIKKNMPELEKMLKKEVNGNIKDEFLPKLWANIPILKEANEILKINNLIDIRVVEAIRKSGKKGYFLQYCDKRKGHLYQESNVHPDPIDTAYAAISGERPKIKE